MRIPTAMRVRTTIAAICSARSLREKDVIVVMKRYFEEYRGQERRPSTITRVINTRIVEHDWKSGWHRLCATERGRLALGTLFSRARLPQAKVFTPECCKVPEIPHHLRV